MVLKTLDASDLIKVTWHVQQTHNLMSHQVHLGF